MSESKMAAESGVTRGCRRASDERRKSVWVVAVLYWVTEGRWEGPGDVREDVAEGAEEVVVVRGFLTRWGKGVVVNKGDGALGFKDT